VVGRESGGCDVELDHQGAMVADGRGGHPGPAGLEGRSAMSKDELIAALRQHSK
jgi:hypothetical protein